MTELNDLIAKDFEDAKCLLIFTVKFIGFLYRLYIMFIFVLNAFHYISNQTSKLNMSNFQMLACDESIYFL